LMLLTVYHIKSRVIFAKTVEGLVVHECRADEHDVVELAAERTVELVHQKLGFA